MLHLASTLVLLLIGLGLVYRRHASAHLGCMLAAFFIDVFLVIYIESTRGAVEAVVTRGKGLVWFHAGVSVAVLLLYVAQLTLGWQLIAGRQLSAQPIHAGSMPLKSGSHRALHRNLGLLFCFLRLLNYGTAFLM